MVGHCLVDLSVLIAFRLSMSNKDDEAWLAHVAAWFAGEEKRCQQRYSGALM